MIHEELAREVRQQEKQNEYEDFGRAVGQLVAAKQHQYGDSFGKSWLVLRTLYPDGVKPDQYNDLLTVTRVIDKLFRIANGNQGEEDAWMDICGYALLATAKNRMKTAD